MSFSRIPEIRHQITINGVELINCAYDVSYYAFVAKAGFQLNDSVTVKWKKLDGTTGELRNSSSICPEEGMSFIVSPKTP